MIYQIYSSVLLLSAFSCIFGYTDSVVADMEVKGSEYRTLVLVPAHIPDSLLFAILTDTLHVHRYNHLTERFENVTDSSYNMHASFSFLLYKCNTVFKRKISRNNQTVSVSLGEFNQNIPLLPRPLSTSGIYRIVHINNVACVEYKQSVRSSRRVSFIYERAIKKQITRFGKSLRKYIQKFESEKK